MVVKNFDFACMTAGKPEANTPLFVDPNPVLPDPVPMQQFKPVVEWDAQKLKDPKATKVAGKQRIMQTGAVRGQLGPTNADATDPDWPATSPR